jgi:hypothetical protein
VTLVRRGAIHSLDTSGVVTKLNWPMKSADSAPIWLMPNDQGLVQRGLYIVTWSSNTGIWLHRTADGLAAQLFQPSAPQIHPRLLNNVPKVPPQVKLKNTWGLLWARSSFARHQVRLWTRYLTLASIHDLCQSPVQSLQDLDRPGTRFEVGL